MAWCVALGEALVHEAFHAIVTTCSFRVVMPILGRLSVA